MHARRVRLVLLACEKCAHSFHSILHEKHERRPPPPPRLCRPYTRLPAAKVMSVAIVMVDTRPPSISQLARANVSLKDISATALAY